MPPNTENHPVGVKTTVNTLKPLILHDVTNQSAWANAALRRAMITPQPATPANHARHHVSRTMQS